MLVYVSAGSKIGYIYWLRVKNSNHRHTELSLGFLKDTKFVLRVRFLFFTKQCIAYCVLLPGCGYIALFRTVPC